MAKPALQVKNIASLVLATAASVSWSFFSRRFDSSNSAETWLVPCILGFLFLGCQLLLIFVESKEEAELSLFKQEQSSRMKEVVSVSTRIQKEIDNGDLEAAQQWADYRRDNYGK